MTQKRIAEAFSGGNFEVVYPFLTEQTRWAVIEEFDITGKEQIIEKCKQTAAYFQSVTTHFKTLHIIEDTNRIAINGTAKFIRDNKQVAFVSSCDVYEFNDSNQLLNITSYCIQHKSK